MRYRTTPRAQGIRMTLAAAVTVVALTAAGCGGSDGNPSSTADSGAGVAPQTGNGQPQGTPDSAPGSEIAGGATDTGAGSASDSDTDSDTDSGDDAGAGQSAAGFSDAASLSSASEQIKSAVGDKTMLQITADTITDTYDFDHYKIDGNKVTFFSDEASSPYSTDCTSVVTVLSMAASKDAKAFIQYSDKLVDCSKKAD